jgi:hypothetical protein
MISPKGGELNLKQAEIPVGIPTDTSRIIKIRGRKNHVQFRKEYSLKSKPETEAK